MNHSIFNPSIFLTTYLASIPPETVGIGPTLSNEALQDLVEVRNELKNVKEANAKAFREMQDMFQ